jgi:AraC family transcriptional activator FtrA
MPSRTPNRVQRVAALIYDNVPMFELGIVLEIFGRPRPPGAKRWYELKLCSIEPRKRCYSGPSTIEAALDLNALRWADTVVVPGWRDGAEKPPDRLVSALRRAHARGTRLISICSGAFVLAATGLLDGKRATTHWKYAEALAAAYPAIQLEPNVLYTDDRTLLTSAGSAAGIDLCLHVVRSDCGAEVANAVARQLVVPPHRDGDQAQYIRESLPTAAKTLVPVMEWARSRLGRSMNVSDLATRASMSPRTFARRFVDETGTTPHRWLVHQRLLAAQRLLETTDEPIDAVAEAVGFDTAMTLRHHFRRTFKTTPTAYRHKFSHDDGLQ